MADENFKFPPGMKSAREWSKGGGVGINDVEAIQRDAVEAARREVEAVHDCSVHTYHSKGGIIVCDGCHRPLESSSAPVMITWKEEKPCRCVFSSHPKDTYDLDGVTLCGYCDRPIL